MKLFNLTDHPSKVSATLYIKGGKILPGEMIEVRDVDHRIMKTGNVAIDYLPDWYIDWKFPKVTMKRFEVKPEISEVIVEKTAPQEIVQEKKSTKKKWI